MWVWNRLELGALLVFEVRCFVVAMCAASHRRFIKREEKIRVLYQALQAESERVLYEVREVNHLGVHDDEPRCWSKSHDALFTAKSVRKPHAI